MKSTKPPEFYEAFAFIGAAGYSIVEVTEIRSDGTCSVVGMRPCSTQLFPLETTLEHICIHMS